MNNIKILAERLRNCTCLPEYVLWKVLQTEFGVIPFQRLQPKGIYIVDFICEPLRLVIEIGGDSHNFPFGMGDGRTDYLQAAGYQIIRFSNRILLEDMDKVKGIIQNHIQTKRLAA